MAADVRRLTSDEIRRARNDEPSADGDGFFEGNPALDALDVPRQTG